MAAEQNLFADQVVAEWAAAVLQAMIRERVTGSPAVRAVARAAGRKVVVEVMPDDLAALAPNLPSAAVPPETFERLNMPSAVPPSPPAADPLLELTDTELLLLRHTTPRPSTRKAIILRAGKKPAGHYYEAMQSLIDKRLVFVGERDLVYRPNYGPGGNVGGSASPGASSASGERARQNPGERGSASP